MLINESVVENTINECCEMLERCFSDFKRPNFVDIKMSRARSYWGQVRKISKNKFGLRISQVFNEIEDEDKQLIRLKSTVLHEIIHTLPKCMNHGEFFKRRCAMFNKTFPGYDLQRCTSMEDYGINSECVHKHSYKLTCKECGANWTYLRKPKYPISSYTCCKCDTEGSIILEDINV